MVKEIEELRLKESAAVEEQKKLSRSVRSPIIIMIMMVSNHNDDAFPAGVQS